MLTKFSGFFLKIYRIKEKFAFVSRRWFSFSLFNFVERFSVTWTALLKMVFPITVMANFSIGGTFTTVVRIFAKLAFFNYLCSLSGALTSRFSVFWNLVQMYGLIWRQYIAGMFASLFGSMTSRYCFGKNQFRFTKKMFCQRIIIRTANNYILYLRVMESLNFTF